MKVWQFVLIVALGYGAGLIMGLAKIGWSKYGFFVAICAFILGAVFGWVMTELSKEAK